MLLEKVLTSQYGKWIELISSSLSLISSVLYVVSTYVNDPISWQETFDVIIMSLFLVEYVFRLFASAHPFHYIISTHSIVDLATIAPLLFFQRADTDMNYMKAFNISRIFRVLRVVRYINKYYKTADSEISSVSK